MAKKEKGDFEVKQEENYDAEQYAAEWRGEHLNKYIDDCHDSIYLSNMQLKFFSGLYASTKNDGFLQQMASIKQFIKHKTEWLQFLERQRERIKDGALRK